MISKDKEITKSCDLKYWTFTVSKQELKSLAEGQDFFCL